MFVRTGVPNGLQTKNKDHKVILRKIIIFDVRELMMYVLAEGLTTVLFTVCLSAGFNAFIYISHGGPIQYCFKFLGTEIR